MVDHCNLCGANRRVAANQPLPMRALPTNHERLGYKIPTIHGCTPRVDDQDEGPITKVKVNGSWSPKKTGFWVSIDRIHLVRVSTTWQKKL